MAYESVKAVVQEYGIAKKQFEDKMKNAFEDIFKTFFSLCPEIKAVGWNQYTPYFNDGEPCEFSVGDFYAIAEDQKLSDEDDENIDLDDINSAYEIEEMNFPYNGKPSEFVYDNRHKYESYNQDIVSYEKAVTENPRYEIICEQWNELNDILRSIPEEIFMNAFDDHVFVLATKDGIDTKEYSHD